TLVIDTVKRGGMLRQVRGLGTLVPEELRWIPAATEGRVERIVDQPGSTVSPDTIILELSNPELEMQALDAESQLRAAEAQHAELKVRLESQHLDQEAAAASVQADYAQARMRADTDQQLAEQGLVADLNRKLSRVAADQLENRNRIEQRRLAIAGDSIKAQLAGQHGTVTVDVALTSELPKGARPDLSVDGTVELERLENILYVGRPAQGGQGPGPVGLFKLEEGGSTATRVTVRLGRASVSTVEVVGGLKEGDQVILSDTSAYDAVYCIRLN